MDAPEVIPSPAAPPHLVPRTVCARLDRTLVSAAASCPRAHALSLMTPYAVVPIISLAEVLPSTLDCRQAGVLLSTLSTLACRQARVPP